MDASSYAHASTHRNATTYRNTTTYRYTLGCNKHACAAPNDATNTATHTHAHTITHSPPVTHSASHLDMDSVDPKADRHAMAHPHAPTHIYA
jgi:hypothetical protein